MADEPKRPGKPERARRRDDDDEDEEPRPKKKRRPVEEDDEDDYDDAPRTKRRKSSGGGGVETIIPYKNGKALAAYYCGVFSWIPFLGFLLGPIAIILGILGFSAAGKRPKAGGKGHAIAGIVLGLIGLIVWPIVLLFIRANYK